MKERSEQMGILWSLLGIWIAIELVYSSGWLLPQRPIQLEGDHKTASNLSKGTLRTLLAAIYDQTKQQPKVWYSPYTTFPETGFVESIVRSGVYDTFKTFPKTGVITNYGASKLSPADTLFTLASISGISSEAAMASQLDYDWFALDIGGLVNPQQALDACLSWQRCHITEDAYALFRLERQTSRLKSLLSPIKRKLPFLPLESAGASIAPFVLNPTQWKLTQVSVPKDKNDLFFIEAEPVNAITQIYRYPLLVYPKRIKINGLIGRQLIELTIPPEVRTAKICISDPCQLVQLGPSKRLVNITSLVKPGTLTTLKAQEVRLSKPSPKTFTIRITNVPARENL